MDRLLACVPRRVVRWGKTVASWEANGDGGLRLLYLLRGLILVEGRRRDVDLLRRLMLSGGPRWEHR